MTPSARVKLASDQYTSSSGYVYADFFPFITEIPARRLIRKHKYLKAPEL